MLRDLFEQAWQAMLHNRRRTMITMIGMAWGIATVVLLLAYGAGFSRAIEAIFAQWGVNSMGVWGGTTSEQAGGAKAGVPVRLQMPDLDLIRNSVPGVISIVPDMGKRVTVQNELHSYKWDIDGSWPQSADIENLTVAEGRFYSNDDVEQRNHVIVLGSEAKTKLYSGLDPIGQRVRLNGISFTVIGVLKGKMQDSGDNYNTQSWIPLSAMGDLRDLKYIDGFWLSYHGNDQQVQHAIRVALGQAHNFRPTDHNALFVADLMEQLSQFRIIETALTVLLGFIGALTLGIAGIGLMNIMLVSVQQRTREIGVEKALGAQKRHILIQFLSEALVITGVGGVAGIVLAYAIALSIGTITFYSAIATNASDADIHLFISPGIVVSATAILIVVGLVSGILPALKAANLDPIEALRYE
jgi:putative ABC transport system permease protein